MSSTDRTAQDGSQENKAHNDDGNTHNKDDGFGKSNQATRPRPMQLSSAFGSALVPDCTSTPSASPHQAHEETYPSIFIPRAPPGYEQPYDYEQNSDNEEEPLKTDPASLVTPLMTSLRRVTASFERKFSANSSSSASESSIQRIRRKDILNSLTRREIERQVKDAANPPTPLSMAVEELMKRLRLNDIMEREHNDRDKRIELRQAHFFQVKEHMMRLTKEIEIYDICKLPTGHLLDWKCSNAKDDIGLGAAARVSQRDFEKACLEGRDSQWNHPSYGFFLTYSSDKEKDVYVEIQYKRISGADLALRRAIGTNDDVFNSIKNMQVLSPSQPSQSDGTGDGNGSRQDKGKGKEPMIAIFDGSQDKGKGKQAAIDEVNPANKTTTPEKAGPTAYIRPEQNVRSSIIVPEICYPAGPSQSTQLKDESAQDFFDDFAIYDERIRKSYVYVVRVLAFPAPPDSYVSVLLGPTSRNRHFTLLGCGGWVAPPMAERVAHFEANRESYPQHDTAELNKAQANVCGSIHGSYHSELMLPPLSIGAEVPVWMHVADPTKEDLYHMVWNLLAGKQYRGFPRGIGFGINRDEAQAAPYRDRIASENPFKSPSDTALLRSSNLFWRKEY